jgi:hypothetical protein
MLLADTLLAVSSAFLFAFKLNGKGKTKWNGKKMVLLLTKTKDLN